ncbi:MAG TPA: YihY family inner membrane protein [Alphaproteobacteria bacterium]|nr:YihY family inner membrane protein [Alphaproteobacteria bacterium]
MQEERSRLAEMWRDAQDFLRYLARRFRDAHLDQTGASLAFTSLLALVPALSIAAAFLAALLPSNALTQAAIVTLFRDLVPGVGEAVGEYVAQFVANTAQLTAFGLIGLFFTGTLLLLEIEVTFNRLWRVAEPRPLSQRLLAYWAMLTLGPVLFGLALSMSDAALSAMAYVGATRYLAMPLESLALLPMLIEFVGFTLLYWLVPQRPVLLRDAAAGAIVAAAGSEIAKTGFTLFVEWVPTYRTVYGALSVAPSFLLWLFIAWSMVLIGALVTVALPIWRAGALNDHPDAPATAGAQLATAVAVLAALEGARIRGGSLGVKTLQATVATSPAVLDEVLVRLRAARFIERTSRSRWVLVRDLDRTPVFELLRLLRGATPHLPGARGDGMPWAGALGAALSEAEQSQRTALGMSLGELLRTGGDEGAEERGPGAP